MPIGDRPKAGYCKICHWRSGVRDLNRQAFSKGWSAGQAVAYAKSKGLEFERKTWARHLTHARHPADALVSYAENSASLAPQTVSQTDFYQAIRDIGFRNALANPDDVTVMHALKAADSLERRKDHGQDLLAAMAKLMMGMPMHDVVTIEGEATEVDA